MLLGVEALVVENVRLEEVLLHLEELVPAHGVDVAALELLLEDLRDRDLAQVGAHAQHVAVHDEGVLVVAHLGREGSLHLLGRWVFHSVLGKEVSVSVVAHVICTF